MDQTTVVSYWTFPNSPGVHKEHVFEAAGEPPRLMDKHGMLEIRVNWIDGKPYYQGHPGLPLGGVYQQPPDIWDTQVGGRHYADMKIQPFQFSMANKLDPMQHTIIKYVSRFRNKSGIQDLEKAKQTIDLLIAWEKEHADQK